MGTTTHTLYEHITLDKNGRAWIVGANTKVIEIISALQAYGWSPAELHFQLPHLSLGQIHSALAYYWDHKAEVDAAIEESLAEAEEIRRAIGPSAVAERLRALRGG